MGCNQSKAAAVASAGSVSSMDWKEVHSIARWNKDFEKLGRAIETDKSLVHLRDPKTMNTPLHISSQNGHEELTEILIKGGAELNAKNAKGQTPLHMAMSYDYFKVVRMLLNAGAEEGIINDDGFAAITGLTGDKTVGMVSFAAAENQEDIHAALDRIEKDIERTDKVELIKTFLKVKKELGQSVWGAAEQARLEVILKLFEVKAKEKAAAAAAATAAVA
jgi:hypothetical protein